MSEINERVFEADGINEKIHEHKGSSSSSSSDSENENPSSKLSWKRRLFGRKASVHAVFGGGKSADIILWRNKPISGGIVAGATIIWQTTKISEVILSEDMLLFIVRSVTSRINVTFATYLSVASGNDGKKFFQVIGALWFLSLVGSWFSFWTLVYLVFLMLHTAPVLYEKHEVHVDSMAEKALLEFNKHYAAFYEKVLRKIPRGSFSDRKQD